MAVVVGTSGNDSVNSVSLSPGVTGGPLTAVGDTIFGGAGNDLVTAREGNDTIFGEDGNDSLSGSAGNDLIYGGTGSDTFDGGPGNDVLDGGADFDSANYSVYGFGITASFSAASGTVAGTATGTDSLIGIEAIWGTSSTDSLTATGGGTFSLLLRGNAGADTLTRAGGSRWSVIADYSTSTGTVIANLGTGVVQDGFGSTDTLVNIFAIRGSSQSDTFTGSSGSDDFMAYGGHNVINGGSGGTDRVSYGFAPGVAIVNLALGTASNGYGGTDALVGIDAIAGTAFNDTLTGHDAYNELNGLAGNDVINGGGGGRDRLIYDSFFGIQPTTGAIVDLATGVTSNDGYGTTDTFTGMDRVNGNAFADTLSGNSNGNNLNGRAGNDQLDGRLGYDTAEYYLASSGVVVNLQTGTASDGEGGTDTLVSIEGVTGSDFNDDLTGGSPTIGTHIAWLRGGFGADTIRAGNTWTGASYTDQTEGMIISLAAGGITSATLGNDVFVGAVRGIQMFGTFNDTLTGSSGDDVLAPSGGNDVVNGGTGSDWVSYGGRVAAGAVVNLALGTAQDGEGGTDTLISIENVNGTAYADTLTGDAGDNVFSPSHGADAVTGNGGTDTVDYGMFGTASGTVASWSANDRTFTQQLNAGVTVDLAAATATDLLGSTDLLNGISNAGGHGTLADILRGSTGANYLFGRGGNDLLDGRAGDDVLDGGADTDQMAGGTGFDTSVLSGQRSAYSLARQNDGTLITFGTDGYDTHTGIEALRFGDVTIGLNSRAKDLWGDLRAGVLWQNGGTVWGWELNGTTVASQGGVGVVGSGWALAGTGDLDGNGRADAVFRNAAGDLYAWRMNGLGVASGAGIGNLPTEWQLAGMGDMDGNGTADMLWRRGSDGALYSWLMQDTAVTGGAWIGALPDWTVAALSDFTGDGRSDILLRKTDGTLFIAQMNGASPSAYLGVGAMGAEWAVRGAGDTNADGRSDIIWQNTSTGAVWRWAMDGATIAGADQLGTVGSPWAVQAVADYTGDGRADVLWRNTATGDVYGWTLGNAGLTGQSGIGTVGTEWQIVA
ncbi:MAG: FG-GAP-like repeat-containing protein [Acetobacteraceae bacterium]|nr:FG-GAP-like repeat-containing protein [Acetobacteraceae bacterium]